MHGSGHCLEPRMSISPGTADWSQPLAVRAEALVALLKPMLGAPWDGGHHGTPWLRSRLRDRHVRTINANKDLKRKPERTEREKLLSLSSPPSLVI